MAKTIINEVFSEFMQNSVDLDPKDVVTARYSRDNLLENIGELDCRGFFRLYPDVNIQFGSFAQKTKKRPLDHVPEGEKSGGLSGGLKIELNETQQKVFLEITKRPGVMIKELSGRLQTPIDTLDKVVSSLRKKELIERRGSKKTGGYWVKKEPTSTGW